jgi:hypothetical protein
LFYRGISDRHDQCSLKARDDLAVFCRIDGDAADGTLDFDRNYVVFQALLSSAFSALVGLPMTAARLE